MNHLVPISRGMNESAGLPLTLLSPSVTTRLLYYARANQAAIYVREHISEHIQLQAIATLVCMHKAAFSRYFADKIGVTFSSFVRTLKVEYAMKQLECSDLQVSELANELGYTNLCSFTRVFKAVSGQTPSEYRRNRLAARCASQNRS